MKILLVSSFLPYPLLSGGNIRLYNLLKYLSKSHEITLVCEKRGYQKEPDIKMVEKVCSKVITVPRRKQWSVSNILKAVFSRKSFLFVGHDSPEMKKIIEDQLSSQSFDLIHVETSYVFNNVPKVSLPIVLVEHNIEHLIYKRYSQNSFIFLRPFLNIDVRKLRKEEERTWKKASAIVTVSQKEKEVIGSDNVYVVPNGADVEKFKLKKFQKNNIRKILFLGDFKYIQNADAASWIIKKIWPVVRTENKNAILWIVGKNASEKLGGIMEESVIFEDNPTSQTEQIFQEADVLLAPIRVGGGTSLKILEAMASGLTVVTTPLGNEGIRAKEGEQILVAKEAWEFAQKISDVLNDEEKIELIGERARQFIEENYRWDKISEKLNKVYGEVIS